MWAPQLSGYRIELFIDNTAVVGRIAKWSMKGQAMGSLRLLLLEAARWDLELHPFWISTHDNSLADALSRHEWKKIANIAPLLSQKYLSQTKKTMGPTSPETPQNLGTKTSQTWTDAPHGTFGGDWEHQPGRLTAQPGEATPSTAHFTQSTHHSQQLQSL
jgi:hypothetical protein